MATKERLMRQIEAFAGLLLAHLVGDRVVKAAFISLLEVQLSFKCHHCYLHILEVLLQLH